MVADNARRVLAALGLVSIALSLAACGSASSTSDATTAAPPEKESHPAEPRPVLHYPPRPPRHVVVRVLEEGSGPRLRPGDQVVARYVGSNPKTKLYQDFWDRSNPYRFEQGGNALGKAWEIGLNGMRVGGRRELVVPSRLAYGDGMMVYVIEPLAVEKRKP